MQTYIGWRMDMGFVLPYLIPSELLEFYGRADAISALSFISMGILGVMSGNVCYIKIEGIFCNNCRTAIKTALEALDGIGAARVSGDVCKVTAVGPGLPPDDVLVKAIRSAGYETDESKISHGWNKWKLVQWTAVIGVAAGVFALWAAAKLVLGFDVLTLIPQIDNSITYPMLFAIGLLTSLHCVGMCGAINLSASSTRRRAVAYNAGRIACYTLVGCAAGALGAAFSIDRTLLSALVLVASVVMLVAGLSIGGVVSLPEVPCASRALARPGSALTVGFFNGFMPCAPLLAMQAYAVSTGGTLEGGAAMLLFGLGTLPVMLCFGMLRSWLERFRHIVRPAMAGLIVVLVLYMGATTAPGLGITAPRSAVDLDGYAVAQEVDGEQHVESTLDYGSFGDIAVKRGVPVRFVINADEEHLTGCNNEVVSRDFGFDCKLVPGSNVIEFMPSKTGAFTYSCWMGMISNTIYVYE